VELTSKPSTPRVSLVHVHDPRVSWCVRAGQVLQIVAARDWFAGSVDIAATLGAVPDDFDQPVAHRVVVVRGAEGRDVALLAAGPIAITDVDPASVLALPPVFAGTAPQVAAILAAADGSLTLLLEPGAIHASASTVPPAAPTAATPSEDSRVR
jgi:hypothetical protein